MTVMKKRIMPLIGLLLVSAGASAQTEVTAGVMRGKDYGVTYLLPETEIQLTVHATKHTYKPGDFCKYAERYLHMKNVPIQPNTYWTLEKIETGIVGVPDKEQVYFVKLKDKTTAPLMELTEDGIVRSINMPYSGNKVQQKPATTAEQPQRPDPKSFLTEEILLSNSTAKMAELVAKEIYTIRESKNALTRGEADYMPQDGAQLKLMLDNLNIQEKAMTEMFIGTDVEEPKTFTIRIKPQELKQSIAFRFSQKLGLVANNDLAGEPIYISIENLKTIPDPSAEAAENGKGKNKKLEGIAYKVPGKAKVTLSYQQKKLYDEELPVSQFGTIEYLAPVLFNKNTVTKVLFDTATGALLKVDRDNK